MATADQCPELFGPDEEERYETAHDLIEALALGSLGVDFRVVDGKAIGVYEQDAPEVLEKFGLGDFADGWVLDLERDL